MNSHIRRTLAGAIPLRTIVLLVITLGLIPRLSAADPFEFRDGDRVVFLGGTLIEREQKYGYWELALTLKNRGKSVTFRNLGWSGDTVFGESRGGFDHADPTKGFDRLVSLTKELKPTVIVICYGQVESFEGQAGVGKFTKGLEKLLDALADTKARIVLMSPMPFDYAPGLSRSSKRNAELGLYQTAMREVAARRNLEFFDLRGRIADILIDLAEHDPPLSENGMHLTETGYALTAGLLREPSPKSVDEVKKVSVLTAGQEKLREKIVEKNRLFFHRWRPQNETYLFGFRKHEQGKNAAEVAEFDPLIAAAEKEIARLSSQRTNDE